MKERRKQMEISYKKTKKKKKGRGRKKWGIKKNGKEAGSPSGSYGSFPLKVLIAEEIGLIGHPTS